MLLLRIEGLRRRLLGPPGIRYGPRHAAVVEVVCTAGMAGAGV